MSNKKAISRMAWAWGLLLNWTMMCSLNDIRCAAILLDLVLDLEITLITRHWKSALPVCIFFPGGIINPCGSFNNNPWLTRFKRQIDSPCNTLYNSWLTPSPPPPMPWSYYTQPTRNWGLAAYYGSGHPHIF